MLIADPAVREVDCIRLSVLYGLRYETQFKGGELETVSRALLKRGISDQRRRVQHPCTNIHVDLNFLKHQYELLPTTLFSCIHAKNCIILTPFYYSVSGHCT